MGDGRWETPIFDLRSSMFDARLPIRRRLLRTRRGHHLPPGTDGDRERGVASHQGAEDSPGGPFPAMPVMDKPEFVFEGQGAGRWDMGDGRWEAIFHLPSSIFNTAFAEKAGDMPHKDAAGEQAMAPFEGG